MRPDTDEVCGIRTGTHECFRYRGHFNTHICGTDGCDYEWPRAAVSDVVERAEAALEGRWFGHITASRLIAELVAELKTTRAQRGQALHLLSELIDPDPCQFDHNHSCQAHVYFHLDQGVLCPHEEAKRILATAEAADV